MLYLPCAAAVFAGSLLQTVTGLGLAILTMAVLPFFLPLSAALAISSFLGVGHSLCSLGKNFRLKVSTKIFVPVLTYFVVSAVMSRFMISLSSDVAIRILGVFLIILSVFLLFWQKRVKFSASIKGGIVAGAVSGIMGALFGINGPPLAIYYLTTADSDEEYLLNIRLSFLITCLYTAGLRILSGYITVEVFKYSAVGLVAMLTGIRTGKHLSATRVRGETLKKAVYGTMILSGLIYLVQG